MAEDEAEIKCWAIMKTTNEAPTLDIFDDNILDHPARYKIIDREPRNRGAWINRCFVSMLLCNGQKTIQPLWYMLLVPNWHQKFIDFLHFYLHYNDLQHQQHGDDNDILQLDCDGTCQHLKTLEHMITTITERVSSLE